MNTEKDTYYFYYNETEQINYCLKEGTKQIIKLTKQERGKLDAKFFEVNSNYKAEETSLFEYEKEFKRCAEEIKKYTNNYTDYKKMVK